MLPLKRILCPTDFSAPSYVALNHAIELAAHFDAELCLLHVVPFLPEASFSSDSSLSPAMPPDFLAVTAGYSDAERLDTATRRLREVVVERVPPNLKARCEVKMGYADKEITCVAADENCDLIVIATHGLTGWRHLVFGSVAEAIVRQARCPVLTVHSAPPVAETVETMTESQPEHGSEASPGSPQ